MSTSYGASSKEITELVEKLNDLNSFLYANFNVQIDVVLLDENLPGMGAGRYGCQKLEIYTKDGKISIDTDKSYRYSVMKEQKEIIEKSLRESFND